MVKLVLVLGDQLTPDLSALQAADKSCDIVVMAEVRAEATYAPHHVKKIAFTFAAMRHFAQDLRASGWTVAYGAYDDPQTSGSIPAELLRRAAEHGTDRVVITQCGEHRLRAALADCPLTIQTLPDTRFIAAPGTFAALS